MKKNLDFTLSVDIFREGKQFVAYAPALDLSTCGKTLAEAKKNFAEAVEIFFEEMKSTKELTTILTNLGWEKKERSWAPPVPVEHEYKPYRVRIPA
jgi:predicted RNase H-like HicB family nuclease